MGGDRGPAVVVPAAVAFARAHPDVQLLLVGQEAAIRQAGETLPDNCSVRAASEVIAMDEAPAAALRRKRDSSMRVALECVADGEAQACVSAGNTGALMAISRFVLRTLEGIERPAIVRSLPSMKGTTWMLDLGANAQCEPEQLLQFATMGAVLVEAVSDISTPTVGLLNIGSEATKGTDTVQRAADLIAASGLNYHGYVEGDDIFRGTTDVVVCDGFTGNVALKTSEGLAQLVVQRLRGEFQRNLLTRLSALVARPALRRFGASFDHRRYNGASLLGLRGVVIKSHGSTDTFGFGHAIEEALVEGAGGVPARIGERLGAVLRQARVA